MSNDLIKLDDSTMSKLALHGDVKGLNPTEKVQYYAHLCQRVGLDPATQPFKLMNLNGKEVFYLDRSGAQQLNRIHQISHAITSRDFVNGCYVVTARASIGQRFTDSLGSVACDGLKGEAFANATMKAETKAKRRATLDLVGLGMLDEMEVETIPNAQRLDTQGIKQPERPALTVGESESAPARPTPPPATSSRPASQAAPQSQPEAKEGDWRKFIVPKFIKKYAGMTLGDMELKDLAWWAENYEPKPFRGSISPQDEAFRAALDDAVNSGELDQE